MASSLTEKRLKKRRGSQPQRGQVNAEQSLKAPAAPRQVPSHSNCLQLLLKSPATGLNISCKIQAEWEPADKTRCATGLEVLAEMDTLGAGGYSNAMSKSQGANVHRGGATSDDTGVIKKMELHLNLQNKM